MAHTQHSHQAVTLSVRIQPEARDQLEILAHATGRTKSFLAAEAIEHYLSIQTWQINDINKSIKNADGKDAYLKDLPLVLRYTEKVAQRYIAFKPLVRILDAAHGLARPDGLTF